MARRLSASSIFGDRLNITVYTLPSSRCMQCRGTKYALDGIGVPYTEVQLDQDADAFAYVQSLGYNSAPVVEVDLGDGASWSWSGYRPSHIEKLAKLAA